MPFVAPAIVAAAGITGAAAVAAEVAIGAGMALALGAASRALAPSPKGASSAGMRLSLRTSDNSPRAWSIGRVADAGELKYHHVFGPNGNDTLQLVIQLADHHCDGLETIYVDGVEVEWNSGTGAVTEHPGMTITWHDGAPGQTAAANLVAASGGRWTTDDVGAGIAYVVVEMTYAAKTYPNGLPKFLFVFRGARLYDIRKDSTAGGSGSHRWGTPSTYEWSDNAALAAYNYLRGVDSAGQRLIGMNTPAAALPAADWIAAANVCDETVTLRAGGTEKRYRVGGTISSATSHREVIEDIKRACAGQMIETGGTLKLRPGAARTVVATITDDDLLDDAEIQIVPKRPRSQLVNAVFGSFSDPSQQFEMVALPPRISPDDEAADGNIRLPEHYALDLVTSGPQGQRVLEILRRRARHQRTVKLRLPSSFAMVESGDWIEWTSERYGWNGYFEFSRVQVGADLTVTADLQEVSTGIYAWTTADELDPLDPGTLPAGGPTVTDISGLAVDNTSITNGAITRPGLRAVWTPVTDATIVSMRIQYRIQGDTTALEVAVLDPSVGSHTWITGVQGSSAYEIRAIPVPRPERAVNWTAWKQTPSATSGQSVATAVTSVEVTSLPANTVTPDMLSPQARRELQLTTAVAGMQGSVADDIARTLAYAQRVAETAVGLHLRASSLESGIRVERITRETATLSLAQQITTVAAELGAARAGMIVEETARVDADSALSSRITALSAAFDASAAAFAAEQTARATADSALASDISSLTATVSSNTAAINSEATTRATADSALASDISSLTATVSSNTAAINSEATTRATADSALASDISSLTATVSSNTAAINSEATTRATADSANATAISTVSSTVAGHTASLSTITESINGIEAQTTTTFQNGYATGSVTLGGTSSYSFFGIMADKVWIGQPAVGGGFVSGGSPKPLFTTGVVDGVPSIGINGNMHLDGSIFARHLNVVSLDAISGTLGEFEFATFRDAGNTVRFEAENMRWYRTDGKADIDLKNRILYFESD